ncbi:MAG: DUF2306 domain-containing protein [Pseudomonadota bacterium]
MMVGLIPGSSMHISIHLLAAFWVLTAGTLQLVMQKGTLAHRAVGWSWMLAMLVVAVSSFWIKGIVDWLWGYGPIHLLSIWVIICVVLSVQGARTGNIKRHKGFAVGAFCGAVGAGLFALAPGRLLNQYLFG